MAVTAQLAKEKEQEAKNLEAEIQQTAEHVAKLHELSASSQSEGAGSQLPPPSCG